MLSIPLSAVNQLLVYKLEPFTISKALLNYFWPVLKAEEIALDILQFFSFAIDNFNLYITLPLQVTKTNLPVQQLEESYKAIFMQRSARLAYCLQGYYYPLMF